MGNPMSGIDHVRSRSLREDREPLFGKSKNLEELNVGVTNERILPKLPVVTAYKKPTFS